MLMRNNLFFSAVTLFTVMTPQNLLSIHFFPVTQFFPYIPHLSPAHFSVTTAFGTCLCDGENLPWAVFLSIFHFFLNATCLAQITPWTLLFSHANFIFLAFRVPLKSCAFLLGLYYGCLSSLHAELKNFNFLTSDFRAFLTSFLYFFF